MPRRALNHSQARDAEAKRLEYEMANTQCNQRLQSGKLAVVKATATPFEADPPPMCVF